MKNMKKIICLLLVAVMLLSVLAGCEKKGGSDETTAPAGAAGAAGTYTVTVKTAGGMAMKDVDVFIYADATLADMKAVAKTNEQGVATFTLEAGNYAFTLSNVPKGYEVAPSYTFSGNSATITLKSSLVKGENFASAKLGVGDVMYDFSVTAPDGSTITLSEVLKEKKFVLLNFFYTTCGPCVNEFPYMQQAYEMYEDAGVIALDPMQNENNETVAAFQASMGLTFPMASCPINWSQVFGITGYPTSICIDRYGVICLVETGGLTSLTPFASMFEHFTAEKYQQKLFSSLSEIVVKQKPTVEMPAEEEIAAAINQQQLDATFYADKNEYSWPFVVTEKLGEQCLKASNQQIDDSFAIIYMDVTLEAGQAFGFDYLISSELGGDTLQTIVNPIPIKNEADRKNSEDNVPVNTISGFNEPEKWETCYPWIAKEAGTYQIAICYLKDAETAVADDTVYIKNLHIADASAISVPTYLPRQAATTLDGFEYSYADVVLGSDGYYHVGAENGPLLLAALMDTTQFNRDQTLWDICYDGAAKDLYSKMVKYFSYASNSRRTGYCTVTEELAQLLKEIMEIVGFDKTENEWLKVCMYYEAFGTDGKQMDDPIQGLAPFCAFKATLGKNVPTNKFEYSVIVMPRGYHAEFIPNKSGVYRITSRAESEVEGWITDEEFWTIPDDEAHAAEKNSHMFTYWLNERAWADSNNVSMLYYMEAGKKYYIDIAFWDPYGAGTVPYDIEYMGASYKVLQLCSPGFFTYDTNATGDAMYDLITEGVDVVLGSDGYYYEDLGNGKQGSKIYADFVGLTTLFSHPVVSVGDVKGLVDDGAFDFSKTENDTWVLTAIAKNNGDLEATEKFLRDEWGEDFDMYYKEYKVEDVFDGIYHGTGEDYTEEIRAYAKKMITSGDAQGCVPVDARLAEILQKLMDKYTFEGVENSWIKMCYYYNTISG